jgi:hypothetical protein
VKLETFDDLARTLLCARTALHEAELKLSIVKNSGWRLDLGCNIKMVCAGNSPELQAALVRFYQDEVNNASQALERIEETIGCFEVGRF